MIVRCLDLIRKSAEQKLCVVFDEDQRLRFRQPTASGKYRFSRTVRRWQFRSFLQGRLCRSKALRVDVFQNRKKQQLFGWEKFVERTLRDTHGICQLLNGGFPHPDAHAAAPRLTYQVPADRFILIIRKCHSARPLNL